MYYEIMTKDGIRLGTRKTKDAARTLIKKLEKKKKKKKKNGYTGLWINEKKHAFYR